MATLRQYIDGGFYIHRGYPVRRGQHDEDLIHTTIQVLPRAEGFFEAAGYRDGGQIEREVFYALLLDGDLSSPSIERTRITVDNIPSDTLYIAEGLADSEDVRRFIRDPRVMSCRHLVEFYRTIKELLPATADASLAAFVCLARYLRQAAYERDQRRRQLS
jgi:hypothetical protein